jgi:GT2 family glycosyltransferase
MTANGLSSSSWRRRFANLPRRILLTLEYEGFGGFVRKSIRFLVRLTPFRRLLTEDSALLAAHSKARSWYRNYGLPVTVIIPAYGDPEPTIQAVKSVRRTTCRRKVRIVVVDDGSPVEAQQRLRKRVKAELVLADQNVGFAQNVNRVLKPLTQEGEGDVVLLNNDVVAHRGWLESLQLAAHSADDTGIVGPKLLYPDTSIQFGGMYRNVDQPQWFDHRFRFKPSDYGPANVTGPTLGVTGACMYIKRDVLESVGALDDRFAMAFEDIDYCLRAWERGYRVLYHPAARLTHEESQSRGVTQGERELASQSHFWRQWGDWFDRRPVTTSNGALRVVYVTEDTGVGGGHRDVFEHLNRLAERGYEVSLYSLGGRPSWFDLRVPLETFKSYRELIAALSKVDAIKVATWWGTAEPVWLASVRRGIPVYFVQDIETSYYPLDSRAQNAVLANYRPEFRYMTISTWNLEQLSELGLSATLMPPGIDLDTYRPIETERRGDAILAVGRSHHLKNLDLTVAAWQALPEPRPELWLFGIEPELGEKYGARYVTAPSDDEVNELMNRATALVQTSRHEGFCLPLLEAMAAGTAVVCTDAHGNRDFCVDGINCLMAEAKVDAVAAALDRVLSSRELRESLAAEGRRTAAQYSWGRRIDPLDAFFSELAPGGGAKRLERARD